MLIGTIDFYHFIPLSLILTLPGSHKVSKAKPFGFIFSHALNNAFVEATEISVVLLNFNVGMQSDVYVSI